MDAESQYIAELKAEIERLLTKYIAELKAEIERLLTKHEKEKNLLLTVLDKQTTEIDRLKVLITQLADWLEDQIEHMGPEYKDAEKLIQLAREVSK